MTQTYHQTHRQTYHFKVNRNLLSIIICSIILSCCSSKNQYAKNQYDFSKLHTYSLQMQQDLQESNKVRFPFKASFHTKDMDLLYLALRHDTGLKSPSLRAVKTAIKIFTPDLIIIEGLTEDAQYQTTLNLARKQCATDSKECSENLYAIYLADLHNIAFVGAEPNNQHVFQVMKEEGYQEKDLVFFYFSRQILQDYREGKCRSIDDLEKLFPEFLISEKIKGKYSFAKYMLWLKANLSHNITFKMLIDNELAAPITNGTYLQNMSSRIGLIRDKKALEIILNNTTKYKKIIVVFGGSHYTTQKEVLEQYWGKPDYYNYHYY